MNNQSDKPEDTAREDTAVTITIGNEPKEITFSVNNIFNSFDKLDKKIKQYEENRWFIYERGIGEGLKLPGNKLIDIWISELNIMSLLLHSWQKEVSGKRRRKESHSVSHQWF